MWKASRLSRIFKGMKDRCYNIKAKDYKYYGARGIRVCPEWKVPRKGYELFKSWALLHGYTDELTLDRIDNSKDYSPENCRWVTMKTQNNNRRSNRLITYRGQTKTLVQWSERLGIHKNALKGRLNRGWSVEKAFSKI